MDHGHEGVHRLAPLQNHRVNRNCKALSLALIEIKLWIFPPASQKCAFLSSLRRKGLVGTLDYLREMVERQGQSTDHKVPQHQLQQAQ